MVDLFGCSKNYIVWASGQDSLRYCLLFPANSFCYVKLTFLESNECALVLVLGDLSCGRSVDLSLYDVENALASSFVTKSEQPCINEMQPTLLEITIDDLQ